MSDHLSQENEGGSAEQQDSLDQQEEQEEIEQLNHLERLGLDFYQRPALEVAPDLLGKILIHDLDDEILAGRILETEAYDGVHDLASHTYGGRRTKRTETLFGRAGCLYIYLVYGLHNLVNIVVGDHTGEGVLLRALSPLVGRDGMAKRRFHKAYDALSSSQKKHLLDGPGKLSQAMAIDLSHKGFDLLDGPIKIVDDGFKEFSYQTTSRIGVEYAGDHADLPYRFLLET